MYIETNYIYQTKGTSYTYSHEDRF